MFSKENFRHQIDEMRAIETKMVTLYSDIMDHLEDENLRKQFAALVKSEQEHARQLDIILEQIEKRSEYP